METRPWEQRPLPKRGDLRPTKTFAAVGQALSHWSRFESHLAILFVSFAAHAGPSPVARRAFGAVRTFEGRLEMLRAASDVYFAHAPDAHKQSEFNKLARRDWREFSARRNEIAHGIVQPNPEGIPGVAIKGYALVPLLLLHNSSKRNVGWGPDFVYSSVEIDYYSKEFEQLATTALPFVQFILSRPRPF